MTRLIEWVDDGTEPSTFVRHTPYLPLDTVEFIEPVSWNGQFFKPRQRPPYIVERDIPTRLVRDLIKRRLARPGRKMWENQAPFKYFIEHPECPIREIHIEACSPTDFYSIPPFFHRIYSPIDIGHKAAHVHDVLCDDQLVYFTNSVSQCYESVHPVDDRMAATIFYEAQQVACVPRRAAWWKYLAVRFGGPQFTAEAWTSRNTI